jgi:hypothetical protein
MSFMLAMCELASVSRQLMASGINTTGPTLNEQTRLIESLQVKLKNGYFRYSVEPGDIANWVGVVCTRLVLSKLTLLVYLPSLFASPNERFSDEVRDKLLVAAIEVAEHNHALNSETKCRQWRWIYQTYTHWYAIVWLLIEISRRDWSSTIERAWIALHSVWLIPSQHHMAKNIRMWVPLRRLMARGRSHRESQLAQIRKDATLTQRLEEVDRCLPTPMSPESSLDTQTRERFHDHWCNLVWKAGNTSFGPSLSQLSGVETMQSDNTVPDAPAGYQAGIWADTPVGSTHYQDSPYTIGAASKQLIEDPNTYPQCWADDQVMGTGPTPWLWTDLDQGNGASEGIGANMDIDTDIDWNTWLHSASGMELKGGKTSFS